ncbi:MAG: hypothetical protein KF884_08420 [Fimbriimonadaceae bacterium]|nr:hypothetical protein [Fimbriimonadaceae bacterium]QYK57574.1 MAG: hypothetical protein KF884_08420 [Fimbriimonadaceae bacterium]
MADATLPWWQRVFPPRPVAIGLQDRFAAVVIVGPEIHRPLVRLGQRGGWQFRFCHEGGPNILRIPRRLRK